MVAAIRVTGTFAATARFELIVPVHLPIDAAAMGSGSQPGRRPAPAAANLFLHYPRGQAALIVGRCPSAV